jgi:hypothetical protein
MLVADMKFFINVMDCAEGMKCCLYDSWYIQSEVRIFDICKLRASYAVKIIAMTCRLGTPADRVSKMFRSLQESEVHSLRENVNLDFSVKDSQEIFCYKGETFNGLHNDRLLDLHASSSVLTVVMRRGCDKL